MALCVCKCLNVSLECEVIEDNFELGKLELTSTEQRDIFFSEKLLATPINSLKRVVVQQALVGQQPVGRWVLHSCLVCGQVTHAVLQDKTTRANVALIPKSAQTTLDQVDSLKKTSNFSPVFNLLVPEITHDIEMKENIDTNNVIFSEKRAWAPTQHVIGSLSKELSLSLQSQLEAVEDSVRQYRDEKYAEFEVYRARAQKDHKILASIISKARSNLNSDGWLDTGMDNGPPSPQLPPLQRRRLSSFKDAKKHSQNIIKSNRNFAPEDDSLDAEDLFDLEGMDTRNNMQSDQDDYDSDQGSHDEGIHISRPRGGAAVADIARSLPINMPFPNERNCHRDLDDNEEPQDIAASIKALARSVHGDVYDLPRPRFSTQI